MNCLDWNASLLADLDWKSKEGCKGSKKFKSSVKYQGFVCLWPGGCIFLCIMRFCYCLFVSSQSSVRKQNRCRCILTSLTKSEGCRIFIINTTGSHISTSWRDHRLPRVQEFSLKREHSESVQGSSKVLVLDPTIPSWHQCPSEYAADTWWQILLDIPKPPFWQSLSGIPLINLCWWTGPTSADDCNERMHPCLVKIHFWICLLLYFRNLHSQKKKI